MGCIPVAYIGETAHMRVVCICICMSYAIFHTVKAVCEDVRALCAPWRAS